MGQFLFSTVVWSSDMTRKICSFIFWARWQVWCALKHAMMLLHVYLLLSMLVAVFKIEFVHICIGIYSDLFIICCLSYAYHWNVYPCTVWHTDLFSWYSITAQVHACLKSIMHGHLWWALAFWKSVYIDYCLSIFFIEWQ